jgi:uncharacterized membrane protein HdeD (DUF308 family)
MTAHLSAVTAVSGMLVMAYFVVSMFFLRFWRDTRDRLFILFALAFALLSVQRLVLTFTVTGTVGSTWLYFLRLFAFILIVFAIIDKNRR